MQGSFIDIICRFTCIPQHMFEMHANDVHMIPEGALKVLPIHERTGSCFAAPHLWWLSCWVSQITQCWTSHLVRQRLTS